MNTTARKVRSSVAAAGIGVLLATAGVSLAPAASADSSQPPMLSVDTAAPAVIGLAGGPVAFTTTVHNTGTFDSDSVRLIFQVPNGGEWPDNALSLEYRLNGGAWKPVPMTSGGGMFSGEVPEKFPLAAGAGRTVQMRIGLPMGTEHHGDSNGGSDHLRLRTMVSYGASGAATDSETDTIKVGGLTAALSGVPRSATAGGPGVTFGSTMGNPTPSDYRNVTHVVFLHRKATVELRGDGNTWIRLTPRTVSSEPGLYGYTVSGNYSTLAAHTDWGVRLRVTFAKGTPAGATTVGDCVFVNEEGPRPFTGTTFCGQDASLTIRAAGATPAPTATPAPSATATATPTPSGTTAAPAGSTTGTSGTTGSTTAGTTGTTAGTTAQLAHTGSSGASAAAAAAGAFFLAGAAAVGYAAQRRRRTRA